MNMMFRATTITTLSVVIACTTMLCGCGERERARNEVTDLTSDGVVTEQTSVLGISSDDKNFESNLVSGTYYVVHDGVYYPLYSYGTNYEDAPELYVQPDRQAYFTTENEINIPTLFEGDELVYYSTDSLLDYIIWERYYDMGYTIGLLNLQTMESGRVYLDLSKNDETNIVPDSELFAMYDLGAEQILIDKIGGISIDKSLVSDGLIVSTKKSKSYDLEVYTGTYFKHYTTTANTHAFKAYELYASIEYEPLQEFLYKIEIPDYLVTGYYLLDGCGMVRIVRGESYDENTDYNEQVLFPPVNENAWNYDPDEYVAPRMYSAYEPLNEFSTNQEGKLGYVSEQKKEEDEEDEIKDVVYKEAVEKRIELYFPKDRNCIVQIKSSTGETTGDISIAIGKSVKLANYDRLAGVYESEFVGKGEKGTLIVSGLTTNYNIILTNCEQYNGQDLEIQDGEENERERKKEKNTNGELENSSEEEKSNLIFSTSHSELESR